MGSKLSVLQNKAISLVSFCQRVCQWFVIFFRCVVLICKLLSASLKLRMAGMKEQGGITHLPEECVVDAPIDMKVMALPNEICLVDTEIPISRARNIVELSGKFLFQQLYSSRRICGFECLLCHKDCCDTDPLSNLTAHYREVHEMNVVHDVAEFDKNGVFVCVPPLGEERKLNIGCKICGSVLEDLPDVHDHYSKAHERAVSVVLSSELEVLYNNFYCSVCLYPSPDFKAHLQHMKAVHGLKTNLCQSCLYCTPCKDVLHEHVEKQHMTSCPTCGEHVCKDHMTEHVTQTHAVQTGDTWVCKACGVPFRSTSILAVHLRICKELRTCGKVVYKCQCCSLTSSLKTPISTPDDSNPSAAAEKMQEEKDEAPPLCEDASHLEKSTAGRANDVKVTEATVTMDAMQDTEEKEQVTMNSLQDPEETERVKDCDCPPSECMLVCAECLDTFCCEDGFLKHPCSVLNKDDLSAFTVI